jgi:hypothetical protein
MLIHQPQQRRFPRAVPPDEAHFFQRLPGFGVPFRVREVQFKPLELLKIRDDDLGYLHARKITDLPDSRPTRASLEGKAVGATAKKAHHSTYAVLPVDGPDMHRLALELA